MFLDFFKKIFHFFPFSIKLKFNNSYLCVSSLSRSAFLFVSHGTSTFAAQR